ncbi:hypothetical protein [Rhizobium grahamii]|uniref:Uncharacterized protein n=2 Tax=Rhizobium grahamii TaxID=1120045 RepID=S3HC97_9HYPH|nr:hypothetical protein [Rhizobium grahamii]EPE96244.1 hypothetical protein RGCCGE502_21205 [Rhizobium grahamii CCGE 502]RDJ02960.1 hypothetical protein B5K06_31185 [Rhizobium grahamii]
MHLIDTRIMHDPDGWKIDFLGDDGDAVTVRVAGCADIDANQAVERARAVMVQLTAFGTRGGGRSVNQYDAASNGNFDDDQPLLDSRH